MTQIGQVSEVDGNLWWITKEGHPDGGAFTGECISRCNQDWRVGEKCSWDGEPHRDEHVLGVTHEQPDVEHWKFVASLMFGTTF